MPRPKLKLGPARSIQLSEDADAYFLAKADAAQMQFGTYIRMLLHEIMQKQIQRQEEPKQGKKEVSKG